MTEYIKENITRIETPISTWVLVSVLGMLSISYAYFINATIIHALAQTDLEQEISQMTSSLSEYESELIALKRNVSLDYARSIGLIDPGIERTIYVSKSTGFTINR